MNDVDITKRLYELRVNIAVDLNGHTTGVRLGVVDRRPAARHLSDLTNTKAVTAGRGRAVTAPSWSASRVTGLPR